MTEQDIKRLMALLERFTHQCSLGPCSKCDLFNCELDTFIEVLRQRLIQEVK
jgi:hypothetical protein